MKGRSFREFLKTANNCLTKIIPRPLYIFIYSLAASLINYITVRRISERFGVKILSNLPIEGIKTSDTLFILGSGSTINEITDEQWHHISQHDSIGLNFWILHKFVPSLLVYEEHLDPSRNELFYNQLYNRRMDYKDIPIIVKDVEYKGVSYDKIPEELKKNYYLSIEIVIPDFSEKRVVKNMDFMLEFFGLVNKHKIRIIPKKSGSVSYLLFLGLMLGYKNIVLCGVDLNNNKYFYDHMDIIKPSNGNEKVHPTNIKTESNVPMEHIIEMFNQFARRKQITVYCGSTKSALYPKLSCYFD